MEPMVSIIEEDGRKIVLIDGIRFKGKRSINWDEVETYLARYRGQSFQVEDTEDVIYIDRIFEDEFTSSMDTRRLRGTLAKAKANATQGVEEMVKTATNRRHQENFKTKHEEDALLGWYRYDVRFSLPVYAADGSIERRNLFRGEMIVRHAKNGKKYLYDIVNIKKETSNPL